MDVQTIDFQAIGEEFIQYDNQTKKFEVKCFESEEVS
jgi:hypothetical protein